jgi:hypothetical protein
LQIKEKSLISNGYTNNYAYIKLEIQYKPIIFQYDPQSLFSNLIKKCLSASFNKTIKKSHSEKRTKVRIYYTDHRGHYMKDKDR